MKRQDIQTLLRKENLPKALEHIILAHHDDLTAVRQALAEMGASFDKLTNLVHLMSNVNMGIAKTQDMISKKLGMHANVESVDPNHKEGLEGL